MTKPGFQFDLLESIPEPALVVEPDSLQILYANNHALHLTGYRLDELRQRLLPDIFTSLAGSPLANSLAEATPDTPVLSHQVLHTGHDTRLPVILRAQVYVGDGRSRLVLLITQPAAQDTEAIHRHKQLLHSVTRATRQLFAPGDFTVMVSETLAILGRATQADRVFIFRNNYQPDSDEVTFELRYAWFRRAHRPPPSIPVMDYIPWHSYSPRWYDLLRQGGIVSSPVRLMPEAKQKMLAQSDTLSLLLVPIFSRDIFWGFMGFDDCHTERVWTSEEIAVLETMAASFSTALERQASEDRLRHERKVADTLREVGIVLTSTLDRDSVLKHILEQAQRVIPYEAANIMLIENGEARIAIHTGYEAMGLSADEIIQWALPIENTPILKRMINEGTPYICTDTTGDPNWIRFPESAWIRSWLGAPIVVRGQVVGVFSLDASRPGYFDETDLRQLDLFVRQAAIALENAQLYEQVRAQTDELSRRLNQLDTLYSASRAMLSTLDLNVILKHLAEQMMNITSATGVLICDFDASSQSGFVQAAFHSSEAPGPPTLPVKGCSLSLVDPLFADVLNQKHGLAVPVGELPPLCTDSAWLMGVRTVLIVPFESKGKMTGFAVLLIDQPGHTCPADTLMMCEGLAQQAAVAIEHATLFNNVRELEQIKSDMIRMASHNLRSPLTRIKGFISRLEEQLDPVLSASQRRYIEIIHEAAHEIERIINDILSLERIEAQQLNIKPIDWRALIDEALRFLQADLQNKAHTLDIQCPANLPVVRGDPAQLGQAISNLVANAIKYTPPGGRITVRVMTGNYGGRPTISFEVQDTGIGVPTDQQAQIFKPFYRVQQEGDEEQQGVGLGLSVVKATIEHHKGNVYCDSEPGKGSLFGFWIPV